MERKHLAYACLFLNLVLPGLGSVVWGRRREGLLQLSLAGFGFLLVIVFIGIPIIIGAWVWALVTGVRIVQET